MRTKLLRKLRKRFIVTWQSFDINTNATSEWIEKYSPEPLQHRCAIFDRKYVDVYYGQFFPHKDIKSAIGLMLKHYKMTETGDQIFRARLRSNTRKAKGEYIKRTNRIPRSFEKHF